MATQFDESIGRSDLRDDFPALARVTAGLWLALAVLAGCGPTIPNPAASSVLGSVRVSAIRAVDDNHLFEARPQARLWTTSGPAPVEWTLSLGAARAVQVPIGSYTLSAFAWYLSDTVVCVDQANGAPGQTCLQPTLGPSLTCDLPVVVTETAAIEATFELLANGHCRLDPGLRDGTTTGSPSPASSGP